MSVKLRAAPEETPSSKIVKNKEAVITDARGRSITIREYDPLDEYNIVALVGDSRASNRTYMQMVLPLVCVKKIDDFDCLFPTSQLALDALIKLLGKDGIKAVMEGVYDSFSSDEEADKKAIKKP